MDEPLTTFMKNFEQKGYLKNTTVIFLSDHGNHALELINLTNFDDTRYENTLPLLFIMLLTKSENKKKLFENNIYFNQQSLLFGYDIYNTLIHIAFGNIIEAKKYFSNKGTSLFEKIDDKKRSCNFVIDEIKLNKTNCNYLNNKN